MKKGFTLIELAIALVVIGLILAMAMKGRAILDSAEIRSDLNKLNKVSAAVASYYSKYNKLPGEATATTWTNEAFIDDLLTEGMVTDDDFTIDLLGNKYLMVAGCAPGTTAAADHGNGTKTPNAVFNATPNLCAFVSNDTPVDNEANVDAQAGGAYACYVETMLDNSNTASGIATSGAQAVTTYDNCEDVGSDNFSGFSYILF